MKCRIRQIVWALALVLVFASGFVTLATDLEQPEGAPDPADSELAEPSAPTTLATTLAAPGVQPLSSGGCFVGCWDDWSECTIGCEGLEPPAFGECYRACRDTRIACLQNCPIPCF